MARDNTQVIFKSRPVGWVTEECFEIRRAAIPEPRNGEILVKNIYLSVDPYMRGRMSDMRSYVAGFTLNRVLEGGVVGQVITSRNPRFPEGKFVTGLLGWETYSLVAADNRLMLIDGGALPLSYYLGAMGMPGLAAYVGVNLIGKPRSGETVLVSAAAGAVGQIAAQLARLKGCRVVGMAGTDEKVEFLLQELKLDAAFNYKTTKSLYRTLIVHCRNNVDVYFDNVGGKTLDAALSRLNIGARIVVCGMVSQYNLEQPEGIHNLTSLIANRATMQGFIVTDHMKRLPKFMREMQSLLETGQVTYRESIVRGIENAPQAFVGMLKGENLGKQLVQIDDDSSRGDPRPGP